MSSNILVLGVGHIGFNVCKEFKRNGYKVYGLTNEECVREKLIRNEIIPIIQDVLYDSSWSEIVLKENIDVVIECVSCKEPQLIQNTLIQLKKIKPQLFIIYTSGSFIFGGNKCIVDEKSNRVSGEYHKELEKLVDIEKKYHSIGAVVIIPTMIYGLNGSYTAYYFECVRQSLTSTPATSNKHIIKTYGFDSGSTSHVQGFIHIYDLVRIYLLVVKNSFKFQAPVAGSLGHGQSIIANSYTERCDEILLSICKFEDQLVDKEIEIVFVNPNRDESSDNFSCGMSFNQRMSNKKATELLGYYPLQPSFIDSIETYYQSWKSKKPTGIDQFIKSEIPK